MDAFGEIYTQNRGKVFSICSRMLRDSQRAEDMTQDIFVFLLQKIGKFRHESKFSTWLHRVVINHVLMSRRAKQPIMADEELIYTFTQSPADVPAMMDLDKALKRLSRLERAVIVRHFIEGYTHAESAKNFGTVVSTTKTRAFRSRAKLQKYLTAGVGK